MMPLKNWRKEGFDAMGTVMKEKFSLNDGAVTDFKTLLAIGKTVKQIAIIFGWSMDEMYRFRKQNNLMTLRPTKAHKSKNQAIATPLCPSKYRSDRREYNARIGAISAIRKPRPEIGDRVRVNVSTTDKHDMRVCTVLELSAHHFLVWVPALMLGKGWRTSVMWKDEYTVIEC